MALDESTEGLKELKANGITAFIDPKLSDYISQIGNIKIDFVTNPSGSGYTIRVGDPIDCSQGGCSCG